MIGKALTLSSSLHLKYDLLLSPIMEWAVILKGC